MAERINAVKTSFFGKGAIRLLGPELQKMGIRRALLVTDRFLYDSGAAARVGQVLSDAGVEYAVYYNVQPNPTVQVVNDCIAAARTLQVQLLVALAAAAPSIPLRQPASWWPAAVPWNSTRARTSPPSPACPSWR